MKEGLIKDVYELIIKEIQTLLSISYILMVGVGMLFNYKKYAEFSINIFQYADVFDFLIAPFEDYTIFIFSLISVIVPILLYMLDSFWRRKYPKNYRILNFGLNKKSWFNMYRRLTYTFLFIFYIFISAGIYAGITRKKIEKQAEITIKFSDNEIEKGIVIGKTKEIIFLLKGKKITAIPLTSVVKEIEIK